MSAKSVDDLSLYFLTFNCARNPIEVDRLAAHLFDALPLSLTDSSTSAKAPEIIALSLQEIAPIAYAFLGGTFLVPYFARFQQAVELAVSQRWEDTAQYVNVVADNVGMTALMVWARTDIADRITSKTTASVGLGLQEMGNKGAVGARLAYTQSPDESTTDLTLIAAHLAPMEDAVDRRNEDWRNIVERLVFGQSPATAAVNQRAETGDDSETAGLLHDSSTSDTRDDTQGIFTSTGYVFVAGDLNYRTADSSPRNDDATRLFPQAQADPTSESHYAHLLKTDQLTREMRESRVFQGLSEAPITFPPTYKYTSAAQQAARNAPSDDTPEEWLWTKTRWPSWCDRVLYLEAPAGLDPTAARVRPLRYTSLPLFPTSDHRAVALSVSVPVRTTRQHEPGNEDEAATRRLAAPFPIDPDWARRRATARTKELVVGGVAYLGWTWEGNGMLVASVVGILGAWLVLRSLLNG